MTSVAFKKKKSPLNGCVLQDKPQTARAWLCEALARVTGNLQGNHTQYTQYNSISSESVFHNKTMSNAGTVTANTITV